MYFLQVADGRQLPLSASIPKEDAKTHRFLEVSAQFKIDREEGELSPNGDTEEDDLAAYVNSCKEAVHDLKESAVSKQHQSTAAEQPRAREEVENDGDDEEGEESAHRSLEESENASENPDVSGSESADGDQRFPEEPDENRDHDANDNKDGSEGEAEGVADANDAEGDEPVLLFSERFLQMAKPVTKQTPPTSPGRGRDDSQIFYGNDSFYLLFRLHHVGSFYAHNLITGSNLIDHQLGFCTKYFCALNSSMSVLMLCRCCMIEYRRQSYILLLLKIGGGSRMM